MSNNIVFYYPSRIVGGTEFLFIRLARFFSQHSGNRIYYIDYLDGLARSELSKTGVTFMDYSDGMKTTIDFEGTLVTPVSNFYRMTDYLDIKSSQLKILFWCLHPYNIIHVLPIGGFLEKLGTKKMRFFLKYFYKSNYLLFKKILEEFDQYKAINFMDYTALTFNRYMFQINFSLLYLPIFTEEKAIRAPATLINNEINVAILGRLASEKIYPIINVLDNLYSLNGHKKINCHIIGEGAFKFLIDEEKYAKKISIIWCGTMINNELHQYLTSKTDLLFAMGTSVLEGASLGIPTIMLDFTTHPMQNNRFKWIFESFDFCVAFSFPENKNLNKESFEDIIKKIYFENQKEKLSEKCFQYYAKNHSLETVAQKFDEKRRLNNLNYSKYINIKNKNATIKYHTNWIVRLVLRVLT